MFLFIKSCSNAAYEGAGTVRVGTTVASARSGGRPPRLARHLQLGLSLSIVCSVFLSRLVATAQQRLCRLSLAAKAPDAIAFDVGGSGRRRSKLRTKLLETLNYWPIIENLM